MPLDSAILGKKNKGTKNPSKLKNPLAPTNRKVGFRSSSTSTKFLMVHQMQLLSLTSISSSLKYQIKFVDSNLDTHMESFKIYVNSQRWVGGH